MESLNICECLAPIRRPRSQLLVRRMEEGREGRGGARRQRVRMGQWDEAVSRGSKTERKGETEEKGGWRRKEGKRDK